MIISCNNCNWAVCDTEAIFECPQCGSNELTVRDSEPVPGTARESSGASGTAASTTVFPSTYPAPRSYAKTPYQMTGRECLEELNDMGIDFDWTTRSPIPTAIILPRPIWICGIRLKYNASGRPERNWRPDSPPSAPAEAVDLSLGPQRRHRRGRPMDANGAVALARFFKYIHDNLHVKQVDHAGIFPGRGDPDNPARGNPHVWGKAIDLCWFYIDNNGQRGAAGFRGLPMSRVRAGANCRDWGPLEQEPTTPKERFMRQMDTELKRYWTFVLNPDDTSRGRGHGNHTTHFHIDVHNYSGYS